MPILLPSCAGERLRLIAEHAKWVQEGNYTLANCWATEIDGTLQFLDEKQFQKLLSRFRDDLRARDAVLAEARAGRFLRGLGFQILEWEPLSSTGHPGDILVQWDDTTPIFVEVKRPDWESELSEEEKRGARKKRGKYPDHIEGRSVSPIETPSRVIRNALKKFADDRPNLVVIVDDLFTSPAEARGVIDGCIERFFQDSELARIGGILFLKLKYVVGGTIQCLSNFYHNPTASPPSRLPAGAIAILTARAEQDVPN